MSGLIAALVTVATLSACAAYKQKNVTDTLALYRRMTSLKTQL